MSWEAFRTQVPGKWVLAGEHSVLRGVPAVALPHPELGLALSFEPGRLEGGGLAEERGLAEGGVRADSGGQTLEIQPPEAAAVLPALLHLIEGMGSVHGHLRIQSTIPFGAGLGSSAALCVAVTRWVSGPLKLAPSRWQEFATRLENHFHGKSSGMDVAVISAGQPVSFVRGEGARTLDIRKLPRFTFHDTGLRARTSECVAQVEAFTRARPQEAREADRHMREASSFAAAGLKLYDSGQGPKGLEQVARAMQLSTECFERWELVPPAARELSQALLAKGARATKLTGAGRGGMVVALWS